MTAIHIGNLKTIYFSYQFILFWCVCNLWVMMTLSLSETIFPF
jgi:hypothetical protein